MSKADFLPALGMSERAVAAIITAAFQKISWAIRSNGGKSLQVRKQGHLIFPRDHSAGDVLG
eukprot:3514220-Amphidinium_carterae.1